jgi:hypothetical protein
MRSLVAAVLLAFVCAGPAAAGPDEDAVRHLLSATFDKPEFRIVVGPIVVIGHHAVAGWSQGDTGGRALLQRHSDSWSLILCSGDGIKSAEALRQAGLPAAEATALSGRLAEAEREISPARLALFAKFEGTMMMGSQPGSP